ncbi:TRAP transporter large permease subunit [Pelagibius sp. Alg239-R121]|uniref:TRAP transporter large permease subunit n=1 Tax=Pelagibius sp. Alg239-R121 TaxID=2993448 RepID=UPI002AC33E7F|nr:TRAP transporter large permease subunit [Pelagibius sp. Alg239-R121]
MGVEYAEKNSVGFGGLGHTGLCLMAAAYLLAVKRDDPQGVFPGITSALSSFIAAVPGLITAMVLLVIGTAAAFGWVLAFNQVPAQLFELLRSLSDNPLVLLLIINVILLFLGTFMDMSPLIVITTPIFLPVVTSLGMDPVQFGIVLMINLGLGLVTPPVGSVLFVGCAVAKIPIEQTLKSIWPFYIALLVALLLVTYVPAFSMTLPSLFLS